MGLPKTLGFFYGRFFYVGIFLGSPSKLQLCIKRILVGPLKTKTFHEIGSWHIKEVFGGQVGKQLWHLIKGCHLCVWAQLPQMAMPRTCSNMTLAVERDVKYPLNFAKTYLYSYS